MKKFHQVDNEMASHDSKRDSKIDYIIVLTKHHVADFLEVFNQLSSINCLSLSLSDTTANLLSQEDDFLQPGNALRSKTFPNF